jgi:7-cyano-7-deazaguanine reductase
MAGKKILRTFPNPAPDFVIEHTHHEFTSVVTAEWRPGRRSRA